MATIGSGLVGCKPDQRSGEKEDDSASISPSKTPLRIWLAGTIQQSETLIRQWRGVSEQAIELHVLSVDELLASEKCPADLLLYPSRLLGELLKRQWIIKLPKTLASPAKAESSDQDVSSASPESPPGLNIVCRYNSVTYALPLGYSKISLLGSSAVALESTTFDNLKETLGKLPVGKIQFDDSLIDVDALVDRFLALAFGLSTINSKYGVLFDLRLMKSRLKNAEFVVAGEILHGLARQTDAIESVVGSHADAWKWVNGSSAAVFALASPSQIEADSVQLDSAHAVAIENARPWNSGSGIVASVTSQCRQSAQTARFAQWISKSQTLDTLRGLVPGLVSIESRGQNLAFRLISSDAVVMRQEALITEPRVAGAHLLRRAIANSLVQFLRGEQKLTDALASAAAECEKIVQQHSTSPRSDYEQSLGLQV